MVRKNRGQSTKRKNSSNSDLNDKGSKQHRQAGKSSSSESSKTLSDILSETNSVLYPTEGNDTVFDSPSQRKGQDLQVRLPQQNINMATNDSTQSEDNFEKFVRDQFTHLRDSISNVLVNQTKINARLDDNEDRIGRAEKELTDHANSISFNQKEITDIKQESKKTQDRCQSLENSLETASKIIRDLQKRQTEIDRLAIKNNLRLVGYHETDAESNNTDTLRIVQDILQKKFNKPQIQVEQAYRIGKKEINKTRHIVFRVRSNTDKMEIFNSKRSALDKCNYYITDDLTEADFNLKNKLKPIIKTAVDEGKTVKYRNGCLYIDGQLYRGPIPVVHPKTGGYNSNSQN